jgi:protein SCO1/2
VSVDGERDTPQVLANYFDQRNVSNFMIGLSGNQQILSLIQSDYDLFYELHTDEQDSFGNYPVDHTANIFLIDPSGNLTTIFAYGTSPETIAEYVLNKIQGT